MLSGLVITLKQFRAALDDYLTSRDLLNKITNLKRDELSEGKTGSGDDIRPYYSEVPGFMFWYNDWKKETIPTYKLDDVPDLYIDGTFYASLFTVEVSPGVYQTDSDYSKPFMLDVMEMHDQGNLLDLTDESAEIIANDIEKFISDNLNV